MLRPPPPPPSAEPFAFMGSNYNYNACVTMDTVWSTDCLPAGSFFGEMLLLPIIAVAGAIAVAVSFGLRENLKAVKVS